MILPSVPVIKPIVAPRAASSLPSPGAKVNKKASQAPSTQTVKVQQTTAAAGEPKDSPNVAPPKPKFVSVLKQDDETGSPKRKHLEDAPSTSSSKKKKKSTKVSEAPEMDEAVLKDIRKDLLKIMKGEEVAEISSAADSVKISSDKKRKSVQKSS